MGRAPGQPSRRRQAGRCPLPPGSSCRAGAGTDPGREHGRPGPLVPRGLMAAGAGAPGSAPSGETGAAQSAGHLAVRALITHGTDLVPTGAAGLRVHRTRVRTCCLSAVLRHRPCFPLLRYGAAWPGPKARTPTSRDGPLGQLAVEVLATLLELPCFVGAFPAAEWPVAWTEGRSGRRWSPGSLHTVLLAWETPGVGGGASSELGSEKGQELPSGLSRVRAGTGAWPAGAGGCVR